MFLFGGLLDRESQRTSDFVRRFCVFEHGDVETAEEVFVHLLVLKRSRECDRERERNASARARSVQNVVRAVKRVRLLFSNCVFDLVLEKESVVRNVAHRKQRLPVLPLLQRDVSFASHELVQHRAHLCRHLFLLQAQKKRGGRGLPFGKGRVKSLTTEKILRFVFFFSSSFEGVQISPFRDRRYNASKRPSVSISISLSIYLSISPSFPLFPFLSSDRFGLRVVGRGMEFTGTTTFRARGRWRRCCVSFVSENRISTTSFWREVWI